jgi:hypothetical protein
MFLCGNYIDINKKHIQNACAISEEAHSPEIGFFKFPKPHLKQPY